MDFFENQRKAKKKTGLLVFFFLLGLLFITTIIELIFGAIFGFSIGLILLVFVGTVLVVGLASLYKTNELKTGGAVIAQMMGGQLVSPSTTHPEERKLMNVIEEMAIASSVPMPEVYVMQNEEGINAFAAGFTVDDAVIGVTAGCVYHLSRDELQGVMAHEFSHILNQDMRLNIKLMAIVFGLIVLAVIGRIVVDIGFSAGRSGGREGGAAALGIGVIGLVIMLAGFLGEFMGNMIKSAVSRQREYLADSSAVQFTRNPEGLSGALKKIGAMSNGSLLKSPRTAEASHMFFGNGLKQSWFSFTSTHPPLIKRIELLDPQFNGDFSGIALRERSDDKSLGIDDVRKGSDHPSVKIPGFGDAFGQAMPPVISGLAAAGQSLRIDSPSDVANSVGSLTREHVDFAAALLKSLPAAITAATRDTFDSCALIFSMLLDQESEEIRDVQKQKIEEVFGEEMVRSTERLYCYIIEIDPRAKLPVSELLVNSLRRLAKDQYNDFIDLLEALVAADDQMDLFEFSLSKLVVRHLEPHFVPRKKPVTQLYSLKKVVSECETLLSGLAHAAGDDEVLVQEAYVSGRAALQGEVEIGDKPIGSFDLDLLDQSLTTLATCAPPQKRKLIEAAAATVGADGFLQLHEAELLRAISDSLGCPMPSLAVSMEAAA
jgi:Zn-dependent protease with chaperone function